jgi:hypothetical protein
MTDRHASTRELAKSLIACPTCVDYGHIGYDKRWRPIPCPACQPAQPQQKQEVAPPEQQAVKP